MEVGEGGELGGVTGEPVESIASEVVGGVGEAVSVIGDAGEKEELGEEEDEGYHVP